MRKFYIYLIISLLAISYPYGSCKGLPQQRSRQTVSTKKKQKRNDGLITIPLAGVCVMIILYFSWDHSLDETDDLISKKLRKTKGQLKTAEEDYVCQKQMIDAHLPMTTQTFFGTNPEVIKNFTEEQLEEEWKEVIKIADRKKIEGLLDKQYRNPSIQENHPDFDLIQCTDKKGYNVLHYAVLKANYPLVQDLFNNHTERITPLLNNRNQEGLSPMDIAYEKGCISILEYLHEQNAKLVKYAPNSTP